MKKLYYPIFIIFFLLSYQISKSQPKFILQFTGSYNLPLNELGGTASDHFSSSGRALVDENPMKIYESTGFGLSGILKYSINKAGNFKGVFSCGYNMYSNSYDVPEGVNYFGGLNYNPTFNFFTVSFGLEYAFIQKEKFNPFIGIDLTDNFFNGKVVFSPAPPQNSGTHAETELEPGSRLGLQFGTGVNYNLNNDIGFVIGAKYHLINLTKNSDFNQNISSSEHPLIDGAHSETNLGITTNFKAMNLNSLNFYAGVSFYFMQPKKEIKK